MLFRSEIEESQMAFNLIKNKPEWQNSSIILKFKDQIPPHNEIQFYKVMAASKLHNIPVDYLI